MKKYDQLKWEWSKALASIVTGTILPDVHKVKCQNNTPKFQKARNRCHIDNIVSASAIQRHKTTVTKIILLFPCDGLQFSYIAYVMMK